MPRVPGPSLGAITLWMSAIVGAAAATATTTETGYASAVNDPRLVSEVAARFERDMRERGIPATVKSCRLMERVAIGVRNSDTAYGAACQVAFPADDVEHPRARKRPELLLCDDTFGETFVMIASSFVDSQEWMAGFIRRTCF